MGFKDRKLKKVETPKKEEVKKPAVKASPAKQTPKKLEKPKKVETEKPKIEKTVVTTPLPVAIETPVVDTTFSGRNKKEWDGIGLIGNHPEITKFRGVARMKGKVVGKELLEMVKAWNLQNPI